MAPLDATTRPLFFAVFFGLLRFRGAPTALLGVLLLMMSSNISAQQWSTATLSVARSNLAATSVGNVALFGGGAGNFTDNAYYNTVDIYDATSGTWSTASLSVARWGLAATSVGNVALFGGGYNDDGGYSSEYCNIDGNCNVVDIYDATTGTWSTATLSVARSNLAATSVGNVALFGGGDGANGMCNTVDIYNATTGTWSTASLSVARWQLAATSVGNVALFGGGCNDDGCDDASSTVDIYISLAYPSASPSPAASAGASPAASAGASPAATGTASTMYSFLFWPNPCTLLLSLWH